ILILLLFIINYNCFSQSESVKITVIFDSSPTVANISKAKLKYNKTFAYSFTLDDGRKDSYLVAFPFFNGGQIELTGITYPGLYYTDGCGNSIPFKAGLAMTSVNQSGNDSHVNSTINISWDQLKEMYDSGWDVFNHSYSHSVGAGTNYDFEISENAKYIKLKTGIDVMHFVVPGGDASYVESAFNWGAKAVYAQNGFPGVNGFPVDSEIDLNKFGLQRYFLNDSRHNPENITVKIDQVDANSNEENHLWYNEFTHKITGTSTGDLSFSTFEFYMNYIHDKFGRPGTDRIWMAPLQEVYEYLVVRDKTKFSYTINENSMEINVDFSDVPSDLRRYALSFIVDSDTDIAAVEVREHTHLSFNETGEKKLINVEWNYFPASVVNSYTTSIERGCLSDIDHLYPNPIFENKIKFDLDKKEFLQFNLYDRYGRRLRLNENVFNDNNGVQLDFEYLNLQPGLYYLEIISEKEKCSRFLEFIKY
ncbi:MAG TPA: polysaccharide deacetylase family protein, partial [Cytophagaceae bacterium]